MFSRCNTAGVRSYGRFLQLDSWHKADEIRKDRSCEIYAKSFIVTRVEDENMNSNKYRIATPNFAGGEKCKKECWLES